LTFSVRFSIVRISLSPNEISFLIKHHSLVSFWLRTTVHLLIYFQSLT
jgi:hypothetical protein